MSRQGRSWHPLDVCYWEDDKVIAAGPWAELLFVRGLCFCRRVHSDGYLTHRQAVHVVGAGLEDPEAAVVALVTVGLWTRIGGESGAISPDETYRVTAWNGWVDTDRASEEGARGNHLRWHVQRGRSEPSCPWCIGGESGGESGGHRGANRRVEKSREEEKDIRASASRSAVPVPYETEFATCWALYPRKLAKRDALKAYTARRRAGAEAEELHRATERFAAAMAREGRPRDKVMHGSTFYGPGERWRDYLEEPSQEEPGIYVDEFGDRWSTEPERIDNRPLPGSATARAYEQERERLAREGYMT
jgi:hypothetical protein